MSGNPAVGSSADFAAGPEIRPGEPQLSRLATYAAIPSVDMQGKDTSAESTKLGAGSGEQEGVAGKLEGTFDVGLRTAPGTLLPWLLNIAGGACIKDEPETGVFRYRFDAVQIKDLVSCRSFSAVLGRHPVDVIRRDGCQPASLNMASGNNQEIASRLTGFNTHGCKFGFAQAAGGNAGAYPFEPILRGTALSHAEPIHVRVVTASPLVVRVEQSAVPTFTGRTLDLSTVGEDGYALWEDARGADGAHLGVVVADNRNPMEIIFPGKPADHALLADGDTWTFAKPGTWQMSDYNPPSGDAGTYEKTSAHFDLKVAPYGTTNWVRVGRSDNMDFVLETGAEAEYFTGSRSAGGGVRNKPTMARIGLNRSLASAYFLDAAERRHRFQAELTLKGPDIGTSHTYQDSAKFTLRYCSVEDYSAPVASNAAIKEGFALKAKRVPDGDEPFMSVELITEADRDPSQFGYI